MSGSKHQIELEENYVNGKLDGVVRIYSNGNVDREKFYKDGEEVSKVNNLANTQEDTNACVTKKIDDSSKAMTKRRRLITTYWKNGRKPAQRAELWFSLRP